MSGNSASIEALAEPIFRIETQTRGSGNLLVLAGQLGLDAAGQLLDEAERLAAGARDVDLDWRGAETLAASSLQVLLALGVSLAERGLRLRVTVDNPGVRHWLQVAGLSSQFPLLEMVA